MAQQTATAAEQTHRDLLHRFDEAAERDPGAVAVRAGRSSVAYGTLAEASRALADRLAPLVTGRPGPVAVLLEPGPDQMCAALAAMRCGKPYLPVDPDYPPDRVERILADAAPAAVFDSPSPHTDGSAAGAPAPPPRPGRWGDATRVTDEDAYVIYTSGSTGTPKGIVVQHRGIANMLDECVARRAIPPGARYSTCASPGFDAAVLETWTALATGGELVVTPDDRRWHPAGFARWLADERIAHSYIPAAFLPAIAEGLRDGLDLRSMQRAIVAVEPIPRGLLGEIKRALPGLTLINGYGPTEAAVCVSMYEIGEDETGPERTPIGTAIRNTELLVEPTETETDPEADADEATAGDAGTAADADGDGDGNGDGGVRGELHIGGVQVGRTLRPERGDRPAFYTRTGPDGTPRPYYRTGDIVRRDREGVLTFLGRVDHMLKVRGYRVEAGDVEHALIEQPGVTQALVLKRPAPDGVYAPGTEQLIAYVIPAPGARIVLGDVHERLRERLPWYAVPHQVVVRDSFPLTAHGKTDRNALLAQTPAPAADVPPSERPDDAHIEPGLLDLWQEVLGGTGVSGGASGTGRTDGTGGTEAGPAGEAEGARAPDPRLSFLANAGDSLAAGRLAAGVAARLGKRVRVLDILLTEDLAALQAAVTRAPAVATAPGADPDGDPPLRAPHPGEPVPATYGQRGLWFHESLRPGSAVYNEPLVLRLRGPLDVTALSRAVDAVVARHEALRTGLVMEGGELRQEIRPFTPHGLTVRALRAVPAGERAAEEERAVREAVRRPFDLVHGPQVRAELLRCAAREHLLVLSMHHSVFDGGSADTLFEELAALYTAFEAESGAADGLNGADDVSGTDGAPQTAVEKAAGLGPPQSQYADFAIRQHALVEEDRLAEDLAYWRGRLDGLPETLDLPTDFPRPELPSGEGALVRARLSPELTERVDKLAHDAGATRYTAFLAALHTLLARYCGTEDLAVGAPFSGRDHPRTERSVGYYLNTLPLRADLGGAPGFRELLARTRRTVTDAYTHQRLPYGLLLERTGRMSSAENPYLQVCLVPEDVYRHEMTFAGIESSFEYVDTGIAKFDLTVNLIPDAEGGLRLTVEYSTDLFRASTVERMVGHFRTLLESAAAEPDMPVTRLRMLTGAERTRVLSTFADGETVHAPPTAVHELVARQAESTPDAPALTDDAGVHLTYRELTERADRLAHYLAERGVDPGTMAGVRLPRGADAVIAFLAVLKTGAAYVPLDPAYPEHRLAFMAEDAGLAIELTPEVLHDDHDAIAGSPARAPAVAISGDDAAYVIYTSGSTGQPKGVQVPHRAVADLVLGMPSWTGTGPGSRLLLVSSLSFDLVTFDIWGALANGAQLVLAPAEGLTSGRLGSYIAGHGITHGNMPTALFHRQVEESPGSLAGLRTLVVGGEALDPGLAATALEANPGMRLINGYGPAEATTYSTYHTMTGPDEVTDPLPIGIPTPNTRVRVLDGNRQAVPVGVTGELHLGGPGLATGYLHRPELTAERFVPDPYGAPGELLYATGDLARWREDGTIDYAGRADGQFKLYGYRVEPGEIEAALRTHPDVASVLVMRREDRPGSPYLAAYYTTAPGSTVTARELRDVASARLPGYMVPGVFTALERFPVTAGGKTDRAALPVPAAVREEAAPEAAVREEAVRGEEPEGEETVREAGAAPAEKGASVLEQVAAIWREVVPVDELDPDERLFDIGGASLHVTAIHERVSERFGLSRLRAVDLFSHPTLRGYAALVERLYTEERGERR